MTNENHYTSAKTVPMATKPGFIFSLPAVIFPVSFYSNFIFCKHKVMLICILINIKHLQNIIFSFYIGLIGENISTSDYHYSMRKSPQQNFLFSPTCKRYLESPVWPFDKLKPSYLHYRVSMTTKLGKLMTILWASIQIVTRSLIASLLDYLAN